MIGGSQLHSWWSAADSDSRHCVWAWYWFKTEANKSCTSLLRTRLLAGFPTVNSLGGESALLLHRQRDLSTVVLSLSPGADPTICWGWSCQCKDVSPLHWQSLLSCYYLQSLGLACLSPQPNPHMPPLIPLAMVASFITLSLETLFASAVLAICFFGPARWLLQWISMCVVSMWPKNYVSWQIGSCPLPL